MRSIASAALFALAFGLPALCSENATLVGTGTLSLPGAGEVRILTLSQGSGSISFVAVDGCPFEILDAPSTPPRPVIAWSTTPQGVCPGDLLAPGSLERELRAIAGRLKPGRVWGNTQDAKNRTRQGPVDLPLDERDSVIVAEDAGGRILAVLIVGTFSLEVPRVNAILEKRLQRSITSASSAMVMLAPVSPHDADRFRQSHVEQTGANAYLDSLADRWSGLLRSTRKKRLAPIHTDTFTGGALTRIGDWTLLGIPNEVDGAAAFFLRFRWAGQHVLTVSANSAKAKLLTAGKILNPADRMIPKDLMDLVQRIEETESASLKRRRHAPVRRLDFEILQPGYRIGSWRVGFDQTAIWAVAGRNSSSGLLLKDGGSIVLSPEEPVRDVSLSFWLSEPQTAASEPGDCAAGSLVTGFGLSLGIRGDCRLQFQNRSLESLALRSSGWHHVAVVRKADAVRLFVDGKHLTDDKRPHAQDAATEHWRVVGTSATLIDDVRVFRRALSSANVRDVFRGLADSSPAPFDNPFPANSSDPCVVRH